MPVNFPEAETRHGKEPGGWPLCRLCDRRYGYRRDQLCYPCGGVYDTGNQEEADAIVARRPNRAT